MPSPGVRSFAVLLLAALAAGLLWAWNGRIQSGNGNTITVGCTDCPPYQDEGAGSPMNHFALDVVAEASRRVGLAIKFERFTGSPRDSLQAGHFDLLPRLTPDPGDKDGLFFSEPWVALNYCLLSKRGWQQHPGARIWVGSGRAQERMARQAVPGAVLISAEGKRLLEQVCAGDVDAAFVESRVLAALLLNDRDPRCDGVKFQSMPTQESAVPASIAARPETAWAARLLRSEVSRMAEDGTLASLHAKWFLITSIETGAFDRLRTAERDLVTVRSMAIGFAVLLVLMMLQTWRLRKLRAKAERSSGLKTRFVANVSHELRTPLSGIVGLVDMLSDTRMTAHQTDLLRLVRSTAGSLVQVINDLLDVAKVEAGQREIARDPFELRAAVDEVCAIMAGRAAEKGIRLEVAMAPGLPRRVTGDVTRLREILMNLLGNALEHTNQGEVRLEVALDQATPFQWIVSFTISDTGVGIPAADLERIFEDLERQEEVDQSPVRRGGRLGIAIGKRLVDLLGGTISVVSPGGIGAKFKFVLPFDTAAASSDAEPGLEVEPGPAAALARCVSWCAKTTQ